MKRFLVLWLICTVLLTSCKITVGKEARTSVTTPPTSEVSFPTTSSDPITTPEPTTSPEPATTPEPTTSEVTTLDPEPIKLEFPEEFYIRLDDIFTRYSLNQNCDGDPNKCTCDPEYEQKDADGNIITPRDRVMSIYFYDIETGSELFVNPGVHYPVASLVKIPYCVYIYEKLTSGEISEELTLTYEKRHYFHGTGVIVKGNFGDQYTVLQLLKLAITESDNVAFEMLKDLSTWEDFTEYCVENGYSHETDIRAKYQKICLESAGAAGRMLSGFLRSDSPFVEDFKYDLTHTKNRMIRSNYTVYRKYGWTNFAFHDVAYIDAPHPYVLAILTNIEGEENADYALYKEVSLLVEEYSQIRGESEIISNNG